MPYLKITRCEDCPHHKTEREHWMDDCYRIFCEHPDQKNIEGFTTKINRGGGIHFNCPLDKPEDYSCNICGWEGKDPFISKDLEICPECSSHL